MTLLICLALKLQYWRNEGSIECWRTRTIFFSSWTKVVLLLKSFYFIFHISLLNCFTGIHYLFPKLCISLNIVIRKSVLVTELCCWTWGICVYMKYRTLTRKSLVLLVVMQVLESIQGYSDDTLWPWTNTANLDQIRAIRITSIRELLWVGFWG